METVATYVAPSTATEPQTVSATHAATISGSTADYRDAKRHQRAGKPLPDVALTSDKTPAPAAEATPDAPAKPLSSRERQQQKVNERIREAASVEAEKLLQTRLADERKKWEAEHVAPATPPSPPVIAAVPSPQPPAPIKTVDDAIQRPDVTQPILTEAKFFEQFPDAPYSAYARYAAQYDRLSGEAVARQTSERETVLAAHKAQIDGFLGQLKAAKDADPQFVASLSERVRTELHPFSAIPRDAQGNLTKAGGPINVIGEQVYASTIAPQVLKHFSQHPEDLDRLVTVPSHLATLPPALRTARHISWMLQEYGKIEASLSKPPSTAPLSTAATAPPAPKPLTDAPASGRTLGSKPAEAVDLKAAAIRQGSAGTATYRDIRRQERAVQMGRR